ncbi:MAG: twin-arginine translocase TatA/TatE family subunit [Planctomycetaceae bacterium]|jgi:TatA/E family protein of Tat protein translocase|nr:twin-arginine translocase TatA/TatE family subunit [Planctomycetaceae bacterium]
MGVSPFYLIVLMIVGVLIFGKELPNVVRKIGNAIMEFKKGMSEVHSKNNKTRTSGNSISDSCKFEIPLVDVVDEKGNGSFSDKKFEPPA